MTILAHGVGVRADLPLPLWLFVDAAGAALIVSFVLLGLLWREPKLAAAERRGIGLTLARPVRVAASVVLRLVGLAAFVLVTAAGLFGSDSSAANPAPRWFYVVFWVGVPFASFLFGDVWRALNPYDTLAAIGQRLRGRAWSGTPAPSPDEHEAPWWCTPWFGLVGLGGFLWLELAYHEPDSPRVVAGFMVAYSLVVLAATARFGRAWLQSGEGFTVLFGLIASMSPITWEAGRVRLRAPFAGLATVRVRPGLLALILVVLGGTTFDGFGRTRFFKDVVAGADGWALALRNTVGLVWLVFAVTLAWTLASRVSARLAGRDPSATSEVERYTSALVPIVLAYAVAHYFSLFWFEVQTAIMQISDPFARGADWLGTNDWQVDYGALSPDAIAYVQAAAIVIGHVAGVIAAHDRAVARYPHRLAVRGQYPLLAVMVAFTVGGLLLLLNA